MANRRYSGGTPQKLGGFQHQHFQGNKVSPWQGGAGPNSMNNAGLISQLSGPQAQLALALSSLLQNQPSTNNNPPSLLSLPTTPAFNTQDNFSSQNRFNNRGRDFRRHEPYNKGRSVNNTWRDNSTRPTSNYGSSRSLNSSGRSGSRNFGSRDRRSSPKGGKVNRNENRGYVTKTTRPIEKNDPPKKQKEDISVSDTRDEDGHEVEKKRDWKQEKVDDDKESHTSKNDNDESVDLSEEVDAKKDKKPREGRYHGVSASLLHCFVCNKSMWDGESFQNHIRGKAHKQMMDSLGQSFQITVNILRENMRLVEEKKMIELERIHRNSRNFHRQQEPQSHCNMCDLKFLGKIISHRKTEGHQRLKRFLHPKCEYCNQEFPSRMEWVDHRFTPDHLRKVKEVVESRKGEEDGAPLIENTELDNDPLLDESLQTESDNPILELTDDLKDLQNRVPAYKPTRALAKNNLKNLTGFYCDICVRFMKSEEVAQDHLRSERHYLEFVETAKRQYKRQVEEEKLAEESKKRKTDDSSEESSKKVKTEVVDDENDQGNEMYDPEEACEENENSVDNSGLEDLLSTDEIIKSDFDIEEKIEIQVEDVEVKPVVRTPITRRNQGAVRNGAGPKTRTKRGGK